MCAAQNGHLEIVRELLKRGADADAKDEVMQGVGVRGGVGNECGGVSVDWDSGRMQTILS